MAGRSNRTDKRLYYITMIITAAALAVLMIFKETRAGIVGFFGWAVCVYIPALFALGILLLMGKRPSVPRGRVAVFSALFALFVCTLHILLAKKLITGGDSYILAPLQGYDTVGGMLVSLLTAPFKLLFSNYGVLLSIFFVLTAAAGFFALYPYILTFKDSDRQKKPAKTPRPVKSERADNKPAPQMYVKPLDEEPVVSPAYEREPLITFTPKEPVDYSGLFKSLKNENEIHEEQEKRSAEILFEKKDPASPKEEKPKYGALDRLAETGIREIDFYTNQGRQRIFEENMSKTFGAAAPAADYQSRYGTGGTKSAYNPQPQAGSAFSGGQGSSYGSTSYGSQYPNGQGYAPKREQQSAPAGGQEKPSFNPADYISKPLQPHEYQPFREIMGEQPEVIIYPPKEEPAREGSPYTAPERQTYPAREPAQKPDYERQQPRETASPAQSPLWGGGTPAQSWGTPVARSAQAEPQNKTWAEPPKPAVQENIFSQGSSAPAVKQRIYKAPPIEKLTNYPVGGADFPENYNEIKDKINEVMTAAGIAAEVVSARRGPTFTRYELKVEVGQSVQKVVAQSTMLKMRLRADNIRILAPIKGKDAVGIEIPNTKRDIVGLRSVIGSLEFNTAKGGVFIAFGKTLEGAPYIDDLAKMPHILIAGATGTGKSVFINCLIMSILYKYSPDDVRLLLIDPKKVELSVYQNLPNLLIRETVKEANHAVNLLRWLTEEMDRRYDFLEKIGCNELEFYNEKVRDRNKEPKIPRIVIVIDEMADLMVKGKGQVEEYIVRIAQLGRAAGIHLVLATQRPTVNVITGLIRANILARVAFTVKTNQDSRIIMDESGAEGLLGNGDLLYSYRSELERIQGAYIEMKDIKEVCNYIRENNEATFNDELATLIKNEPQEEQPAKDSSGSASERDSDYEATLKRILKTYIIENRASISNAQAKHNVGYIKAKKILDDLADRGYVSNGDPSKPRQVLITMEEYKKIFESDE